jgi:hypothetical protein
VSLEVYASGAAGPQEPDREPDCADCRDGEAGQPRRVRLRAGVDADAAPAMSHFDGTISTGQVAARATRAVFEPNTIRSTAPRPWTPITIRSACRSAAIFSSSR